jgi:succinylglutamic semialdehyde dehydrogenase
MAHATTPTNTTPHPANLIGADTESLPASGDQLIESRNPAAPDDVVWRGAADASAVDRAAAAARDAQPQWFSMGFETRKAALEAFAAIAKERVEHVGDLIMRETGKARWDAHGEAKILAGKIAVTLEDDRNYAMGRLRQYSLELGEGKSGHAFFRPHGVMAVVGPFNFPAHLPNGHIAPALLAGNAVIFKPSDKAPAVGHMLAAMYREALASVGAPLGIVNLVQGAAPVAQRLVTHDHVDGVLFTGSWPVGRRIIEANLDHPGRIIALELGGNNAALVTPDADLKRAAVECARAAFVTTGQRCTCTRRIVVHDSVADRFMKALIKIGSNLIVGDPKGIAGDDVFMGPIVTERARDDVLKFQAAADAAGGQSVMTSTVLSNEQNGHYITPGIMRVDRFSTALSPDDDPGCDVEVFGPLVRVSTYSSFDDGLAQVNASRYGLAASIFTGDQPTAQRFLHEANAGCINVNTGTAGASGKLPFGGLGLSGNHRPAGAFSLDYSAYPVASMQEPNDDQLKLLPGMRFDEKWLD